MTIREMMKKAGAYNEVAQAVGLRQRAYIEIVANYTPFCADTYRQLSLDIRSAFIDQVAKAILDCDRYEFDKPTTVEVVDGFGTRFIESVHPTIYLQ